MGFWNDNTADGYEAALAQAESNPKNLTKDQKEKIKKLQKETGERGNRARKAL